MVIQYWARHVDGLTASANEPERINELLPATRRGIRGTALKDYLASRGFDAFLFDGEASDLHNHIARGRPLIVCLAPRGPRAPLHYAVVVGVDEQSVWLHDSARGKLFQESLESFESAWSATGRWTLLAVPRRAQ